MRATWGHGMSRVMAVRGGSDGTSGPAKDISEKESDRCNRNKGGGKELHADVLIEVFSHLPQKDLFDVMLVSRDWSKAVINDSALWRNVAIISTWDSGAEGGEREVKGREGNEKGVEGSKRAQGRKGRVPEVLSQMLRVAEAVRFPRSIPHSSSFTVRVGGTILRYQLFQGTFTRSITPSLFPVLLANCPNLKSLSIEGKLVVDGTYVHICHPGLEKLKFAGWNHFTLILECPALLDLYFDEDSFMHKDLDEILATTPSLNCPRLTSLHLSECYSNEGILEVMGNHALALKRLKVHLSDVTPFESLLHFEALRDLTLVAYHGVMYANVSAELPSLERLDLEGHGVWKDLKVAFTGLRLLTLREYDDIGVLGLECPLLECLQVKSQRFEKDWDKECLCPQLKKIHVVCDFFGLEDIEEDGALDIHSDVVEELVLQDWVGQEIVIACKKLRNLVIGWLPLMAAPQRLPTTDAPNLKNLELDGYPSMLPSLPSLLSTLPVLEVLRTFCGREDVREVVLEHVSIFDLVVGNATAKMDVDGGVISRDVSVEEFELTLIMPSLLRVDVEKSNVCVLRVFERGEMIVITAKNGCRLVEVGDNV